MIKINKTNHSSNVLNLYYQNRGSCFNKIRKPYKINEKFGIVALIF